MGSDQNERRWRVFYLPDHFLPELFNWQRCQSLTLPVPTGIAEGWRVVDVLYDWNRRAFAVRIAHPSFDPVPDGAYTPDAGLLKWQRIDVGPLFAAEAIISDLKEDSTAYQRGLEDGIRMERTSCAAIAQLVRDAQHREAGWGAADEILEAIRQGVVPTSLP